MPTMTQRAAPEPATDAELARSIASGDQSAFVLLMRRHNQLLFRTARSILHDDRDAEDAVQDAYLQAYRSIAQFRGDARLSTWLTRIVVNASIARAQAQPQRRGHAAVPGREQHQQRRQRGRHGRSSKPVA